MTAVGAAYAEYLQSAASWTPLTDAPTQAKWGDLARESSFVSPIDAKADADAEVTRQLTFLREPVVRERVLIPAVGIRDTYRGRCITVRAAAPGYEGAGALVFVLGGTEDRAAGITVLEVLRKLS